MLFSDLFHLPLIFFLVRGTLSASVVTHLIAKNFTTPIKSNHEIELRTPVSKIKPQDSNEKNLTSGIPYTYDSGNSRRWWSVVSFERVSNDGKFKKQSINPEERRQIEGSNKFSFLHQKLNQAQPKPRIEENLEDEFDDELPPIMKRRGGRKRGRYWFQVSPQDGQVDCKNLPRVIKIGHPSTDCKQNDEELCFCIGDVEQSVRRQEGDGADFDFKDIPFQVNYGTCRIPFDIQWFEE